MLYKGFYRRLCNEYLIRLKQAATRGARKLATALAVACLALMGLPPTFAQPVEVDKVVAIVDDDVVLKSEFDERWAQVEEQLAQATGPLPPLAELRKQVLDTIIIEHLQLQMAERAGVRVDDNQLNEAMTTIAARNNMNFEQFRDVLEAQGLYQATREALRKEIIIGQFQNGAVNREIEITRQEVENYLRSEAGLTAIAPEYHVAHILIPNNGEASTPRQAELADLLYQELQKGASIVQMAGARQISGMAVSGGDLGWNKREALPTLFASIVPTLQPGEVSDPFTSPNGHHIVQLLETRGGSALQLNQARVRHILITPNEIRTDAQAEQLIHDLYQRIQNGEDFADIARQNSDDATSIVAGGNLNWINDGMLPPDFMAVVHATPVGEMTAPFKVSTGWHIIEVLERRVEDVTEDNKRFQAQQILRERKFETELENWLTRIRDTSYIDIKDF
jgi:peptidyl-prolyl cis-trans isomerase SurA